MKQKCSKCGNEFESEKTDGVCPSCLGEMVVNPTAEPVEELPLQVGGTFGGLEVVELVGRGGMGVVYKARQPRLNRFVALKVLPRKLGADAEFRTRFGREAAALAGLAHPNIVSVHDYGLEGDLSYLVMEFVEGVNLRDLLRERRLTPAEALKIVPQLCDALEYAHGEGIVHRDIKPENLLIDKRGRVKITDFGLAKMVGEARTKLATLTQLNVTMGTPHYMAPEQLENPKEVDHRADIYSMGVVFYEMLTGELPIGKFAPPSRRVEVDVRIDEVVLKTLEKSPEERYQRASDVKADVTRIGTAPTARRRKAIGPLLLALISTGSALLGVALGFALFSRWGKIGSTNWPPAGATFTLDEPQEPREEPDFKTMIASLDDPLPGGCRFSNPADSAENPEAVRAALKELGVAEAAQGVTGVWRAKLDIGDQKEIGLVLLADCATPDVRETLATSLSAAFKKAGWSEFWTRGHRGNVLWVVSTAPGRKTADGTYEAVRTALTEWEKHWRSVQGPPAGGERVTLNLKDADIKAVIALIRRISKAQVVLSPEVKGTVSVSADNVPWRDVLESAVKAAGPYHIVEDASGILRVVPNPQATGPTPKTERDLEDLVHVDTGPMIGDMTFADAAELPPGFSYSKPGDRAPSTIPGNANPYALGPRQTLLFPWNGMKELREVHDLPFEFAWVATLDSPEGRETAAIYVFECDHARRCEDVKAGLQPHLQTQALRWGQSGRILWLAAVFAGGEDSQRWAHALDNVMRRKEMSRSSMPRLSVTCQNADVRKLAELVAQRAGGNVVLSPQVGGMATVTLKDVPWVDGLRAILSTVGDFVMVEDKGVWRIQPMDEWKREKERPAPK